MPTYDYTCSKCGHSFEFQQSISEAALTQCPKSICPKRVWGRGAVKRGVGGGTGLIFKGSGFYITDYRSEGYKSAAKKDKEASGGGAKTDSGSGGAKTSTTPSTGTASSGGTSKSEKK
ncbi:MAG: zinc ribbon domain-containing protein [Verrucomicrobia bacterium]|nr:zinc ribbon domain-containing protein [Verrucomicrobiota bacterium]